MKKRLKTTAQKASRRDFMDDDVYGEEPNMRLSRAFVVVLVLHVVAVGGIFMFNKIQTDQVRSAAELPAPVALGTSQPPPAVPTGQAAPAAPGEKVHFLRAGENLRDVAATYGVGLSDLQKANNIQNPSEVKLGQRLSIPPAADTKPSQELQRLVGSAPKPPTASPPKPSATASARTYTVVAGDNPVGIARQFDVDYQDLLKLNNIADPRLLQIGQVLKIPNARE